MAIHRVQFDFNTTAPNVTTGTVTVPATVAGNDIVISIFTIFDSADQSVVSVTDSAGNTYVHVPNTFQTHAAGGCSVDIWQAHNIAGGDVTVTVTIGVSAFILTVSAYEVSGLNGSVDDSGGTGGTINYIAAMNGGVGDFFVSSIIHEAFDDESVSPPWTLDYLSGGTLGASLVSSGNQTVTFFPVEGAVFATPL